jgi:hypothetical protein
VKSLLPLFSVSTCLLLVGATSAAGQIAHPASLAFDTAASFDQTRTFGGDNATGVIVDAVMSVGFGAGFEGMIRPWAQRQANGEWNKQIWVAAVRYQRPGPIGLRVDAGLIPSPVGLSNLLLRPQLNPTVSLPASLFTPLPPIDVGAPRVTLLGAVYAYGATATVSGTRWDLRTAVVDTSPPRTRRIFGSTNPPRFDNVLVGGGHHASFSVCASRIGDSRAAGNRPARVPRAPRTAMRRLSRSNPSSPSATRSCSASSFTIRSRRRAASASLRAGSCRDSRR